MKTDGTKKIYYEDQYLTECKAIVVKVIKDKGVVLDQTVAFPEGGGQEGDKGYLVINNKEKYNFIDTQKGVGRPIFINDFPMIQVDTPIYHILDGNNYEEISVGDEALVVIDVERRAKLSLSHTASHLLFIAVNKVREGASNAVIGCHITPEYARFDYLMSEKISQSDLKEIEAITNQFIDKNLDITLYCHPKEKEAWYWKSDNEIIPCGGTHIKKTGKIGKALVKRKNIGKNKERLTVTFPEATLELSDYHNF